MTIKNGDLPAMPIEFSGFGQFAPEAHSGLNKREELSARFMAAMLTNSWRQDPSHVAGVACVYADALLEEWAK